MTQATELEFNISLAKKFLAAIGSGDVAGVQEVIADDIDAICTGTGVLAGSRNYAAVCDAVKMLANATKNGLEFRIISTTAEANRVACELKENPPSSMDDPTTTNTSSCLSSGIKKSSA